MQEIKLHVRDECIRLYDALAWSTEREDSKRYFSYFGRSSTLLFHFNRIHRLVETKLGKEQYVWGFDSEDVTYQASIGYEMFDFEADARVAAEGHIQRFCPKIETYLIGVLRNKILVEIKKVER